MLHLLSVLDREWEKGLDTYGTLIDDSLGWSMSDFRYKYKLGAEDKTWFFGWQPVRDAPNAHWTTCKVEFNPAKVGKLIQFTEFYSFLIANCKYLEFKRFDVAMDIPVPYSHVHIFKDVRMMRTFEHSAENKTVYLGTRGAHGQVKLYNKQLESKLDYPLTRLEMTLKYDNCSWMEFQRLFPKVYVYEKVPDSFTGTDLVLALAVSEHSEYMNLIPRRKREKIMCLLDTDTFRLKPSEIDYKLILQEILQYGKGIPLHFFEEFMELDEDLPIEFPETETFKPTEGEQEEMDA